MYVDAFFCVGRGGKRFQNYIKNFCYRLLVLKIDVGYVRGHETNS